MTSTKTYALLLAAFCIALISTSGCTHNIPNTSIRDTPENRRVLHFMEEYRRAMEALDVEDLLALASPDYYDDNGTPIGSDDRNHAALEAYLNELRQRVEDISYNIRVLNVHHREQQIFVEYRYSARYYIRGADGEPTWQRHVNQHRAILVRDEPRDTFLFMAGM